MQREELVRGIGVRQLAAGIINGTVGAGIFVVPALVAQGVGAAAPIVFAICGATMALIAASFAVGGSRVSRTGGLFAYVEAAFGPFAGFVALTLQWLGFVASAASVSVAFLDAMPLLIPALAQPALRLALLASLLAGLAAINVRGVTSGARTVEWLTLGKLIPLALFVVIGVSAVQPETLGWPGMPDSGPLGRTVLLAIFAFLGIELALTPSAEIRTPSKTVPRAILIALVLTTSLYIAIQVVAQGVLGASLADFAQSPLAEAASRFMGASGATFILAGSLVSMFGYISGDMLASPRNLYAFGRDGFLPLVGRVHSRYKTPSVAIGIHAVLLFALASSNTFIYLAIVANVATLSLYFFGCAAAIVLMKRPAADGGEGVRLWGGPLVPLAAMGAIAGILSSATWQEFAATAAAAAVGAVIYAVRRRTSADPVSAYTPTS